MRAHPQSFRVKSRLLLTLLFAAFGSAPGADHTPPQDNHGYIGIKYQFLSPEALRERKLPADAGVLITDVHPTSPAAAAGLQKQDVLLECDGRKITDEAVFSSILQPLHPGMEMTAQFIRDGQTRTTTLTVGVTPPAVAYLRRASSRAGLGDHPGAIADFTEVIRLEPRQVDAYLARGWAKANIGDRPGAIADYTEAIRLEPQHFQAYLNRGIAKADGGDRNGAIADYTEAIRLEPRSYYAYFNRALAKANSGDFTGAIADYSVAIGLEPMNADAFLNRGLARTKSTQAGGQKQSRLKPAVVQKRSAEAMADYAEANRLYTEAIRLDPKKILAYEYRAMARDQLQDRDGAAGDRAMAAQIREQAAFAKFRQAIASASLPDLLVSSEQNESQARERNRAIIAAKITQLPALLRDKKTEELSAFVVKIEQTILDLNHESEVAKDRAQQAMANNGPAGQIEELRGLTISYRERIELLKPILAALKEEITNRSR